MPALLEERHMETEEHMMNKTIDDEPMSEMGCGTLDYNISFI
jgi:hypothetical protein